MNFRRWLIEASFSQIFIVATFWVYYVRCIPTIFDEYQTVYIVAIMLKIPLFFLMRYAEYEPDYVLNKFEADIVSTFCELRST